MGMSTGSSKDGASPNINVTPLIDVLLVLLIIFMVITPSKPSRFEAKVPAEPKEQDKNVILKQNPNTLILFVNRDGKLRVNLDDVGDISDIEPLTAYLKAKFEQRERDGVLREGTNEVEKTIFVKAPKSVRYGDIVKAIDGAKMAGANPIGLQIDDLEN
jgi:biopolymer transport protein ExbD